MLAKTFQALQRRSSRFRRGHGCGVCVWHDRRGGLGAFGTDGAKDAGPFASGIARRPAGRHALCAGATPRFSCRAPHRAGRPVPWRQSFQTPPGPAGRISGGRTERRRNPSAANCLPAVRSCIVTPKRLSISRCRPTRRQPTTPCVSGPGPARTSAASAALRAASRSGSRHSARQAPQDLPRCSDGANPVAAGSPSRVLRLPTCGRRSLEPMRPPPYAARPWHHGSGSRQHETPSTSNPSARSQPPSKPPSFDESEPEPAPYGNPQRRQAHWPVV